MIFVVLAGYFRSCEFFSKSTAPVASSIRIALSAVNVGGSVGTSAGASRTAGKTDKAKMLSKRKRSLNFRQVG